MEPKKVFLTSDGGRSFSELKIKRYRYEWMHRGNWRMDSDGSGTFNTREKAEAYAALSQRQASAPLTYRIVEVV